MTNIKFVNRTLIFILFVMTFSAFAKISININPPETSFHEPFQIIYTVEQVQPTSAPDLSPLQKDFVILGTEQSSHYNSINGKVSIYTQFTITLMAKKFGKLTIPALKIGQLLAPAGFIEISKNAKPSKNTNSGENIEHEPVKDSIMLKTELSQKDAFINQQVLYSVKLYNNGQLLNTSYQPPKVNDALLIPLKDGYRYHEEKNGQNYLVEVQKYAIFPQKNGTIQITPPSLNALVYDITPRRISLTGDELSLKVRPIAEGFNSDNWLPARSVSFEENYDNTDDTLPIGSTITRSVTLQAVGLPAQLLPILKFGGTDSMDVYQDKAEIDNILKQQDVVGSTTINVTYVLHKDGKITIPEITLPWFNTITGKKEIAKLPPKNIIVQKKPGSDTQDKATSNIHSTQKQTQESKLDDNAEPLLQKNTHAESHSDKFNSFQKITLDNLKNPTNLWWLFSGFVLASLLFLFYKVSEFLLARNTNLKKLKKACLQNDPTAASEALINWAKNKWPDCKNLHDVKMKINHNEIISEIDNLSEALYSHNAKNWYGKKLWQLIKKYRFKQPANKKKKSSDLPPMNPR